jgi:hypothetical protein
MRGGRRENFVWVGGFCIKRKKVEDADLRPLRRKFDLYFLLKMYAKYWFRNCIGIVLFKKN